MPQHATQTLTLGTSLNIVSVLAALAAGWAVAETTSGVVARAGHPSWQG